MDILNNILEYTPYVLGALSVVSGYVAYKIYHKKPPIPKVEPPVVQIPKPSESIYPVLKVQPIPKSMFGINARSRYPVEWRLISQRIRSSGECDTCLTAVEPRFLDAHEVWDFVLIDGIVTQKLVDIQCLCKKCHALAHPNRTIRHGKKEGVDLDMLNVHAIKITGMTLKELCDLQFEKLDDIQKMCVQHVKPLYDYALDVNENKIIYYEMDLRYLNEHFPDIIKHAKKNEMQYFDFRQKRSYTT